MSTQRVGSYEIVRMLARGGMAVVYLVRQPALDREVVLKRLDLERDDPTLAQRFVREAQLAAGARPPEHRHAVRLLRVRRRAVHRDGVRQRRVAALAGRHARPPAGAGRARGGAGRARPRGAARDRAPRPEARERAGHAPRQRQDRRLRDRARLQRAEPAADRHRQGDGHAGVHGAGAGDGRADRAADRPVRARGDRLRAARGAPAVRVRQPDGRPLLPRPQAAAAAARLVPRPTVRHWVGWLLEKAPADRPPSADAAWQALEEIAVSELGPYWRRAAAITIPTGGHDTPRGEDEDEDDHDRRGDRRRLPCRRFPSRRR